MKNILIVASIAGAAIAGIILYYQNYLNVSTRAGDVVDAASNALKDKNHNNTNLGRPAQHAMG
jgi:hypothetical protein